MIACTRCRVERDESQFSPNKGKANGLQSWCRPCCTEHHRIKRYGISAERVNELLAGGCQVCGSFERLHIDHNHDTGVVRGCLCHRCNVSLGMAGDSGERLRQIAAYIESFE